MFFRKLKKLIPREILREGTNAEEPLSLRARFDFCQIQHGSPDFPRQPRRWHTKPRSWRMCQDRSGMTWQIVRRRSQRWSRCGCIHGSDWWILTSQRSASARLSRRDRFVRDLIRTWESRKNSDRSIVSPSRQNIKNLQLLYVIFMISLKVFIS